MEAGTGWKGRNRYRGLFVVDLDGTLLSSERRPAEQDLEALASLRDNGYLVAIATGRSNYSFELLVGGLTAAGSSCKLPVDFVIFSTGAGIMDFPGGRLLYSLSLKPAEVRDIVNCLDRFGVDYMVHRPVPDTRYFHHKASGRRWPANPDFARRLAMYQAFASPLTAEALAVSHGATEVLCVVPEAHGDEVALHLAESLDRYSVIRATSPLDHRSVWVEIFAPTVSKSSGARWLADRFGLARHQVAAIGNDYNDEDLLDWAGRGFVVANGPSRLKRAFTVVPSNDQGGVRATVEQLLGTNRAEAARS